MNITPKQARFVGEYALDFNAARAARAAGYSPKGAKVAGCRLLTSVNVQAVLAAKQAEAAQRLELDRETIVTGILGGIATARLRAEGGNMIRGWVEVAKMLNLYAPEKIEVTASASGDAIKARYAAMSDDELIAIMEGR